MKLEELLEEVEEKNIEVTVEECEGCNREECENEGCQGCSRSS